MEQISHLPEQQDNGCRQLKRDFAPFIGSIAMLPVLTKSSRFRHIIGL
jgi:hypothetical protein